MTGKPTPGPEVVELLELVQTRLGMTEMAAQEYVWQGLIRSEMAIGGLPLDPSAGGQWVRAAVAEFHSMPALA